MITGKIIAFGTKDGYSFYEKDLIGKEVEFNLEETTHRGAGWWRGAFHITQDMKGLRKVKGELLHFDCVRIKIVKK